MPNVIKSTVLKTFYVSFFMQHTLRTIFKFSINALYYYIRGNIIIIIIWTYYYYFRNIINAQNLLLCNDNIMSVRNNIIQ